MEPYHEQKLKTLIDTVNVFKLDRLIQRLKKSINIDDIMVENQTLLSYAIKSRRLDVVNYLIGKGVDVNKKCKDEMPALYVACCQYRLDGNHNNKLIYYQIITHLIAAKADCNYQCEANHGFTCLMHICHGPVLSNDLSKKIIKLLLDNGANLDIKNKSNQTASYIAGSNGNREITNYIDDYKKAKASIDAYIDDYKKAKASIDTNANANANQQEPQPVVVAVTPNPSIGIRHLLTPVVPIVDQPTKVNESSIKPETIDPEQKFINRKRELEQSIAIANLELQLATAMFAIKKVQADTNDLDEKQRGQIQDQVAPKSV